MQSFGERLADAIQTGGGFQAMRGHGGLTARVIAPGTIRIDDSVRAISVEADEGADP